MDVTDKITRLQTENEELRKQLTAVLARVEALQQRVRELEAQLGQDSHNSNWPPSRDKGRQAKQTRSLRQKSERRAGGQSGHEGKTLELTATPDQVVIHRPQRCAHCDHDLSDYVGELSAARRQVFDVPPLALFVTEHRVAAIHCPGCQRLMRASFPAEALRATQYGSNLKALSVYLNQHHLLPVARVCQCLNDLLGTCLSAGSVSRWSEEIGSRVAPLVDTIRTGLRQAQTLHVDETGLYIGGRRHWLHVAATQSLTCYQPHTKRGKQGSDAMEVLPHFQGCMVHDNWSAYAMYDCRHALCNVHHLRELTYLHEEFDLAWAEEFKTLLLAAKAQVAQAKVEGLSHLSCGQRTAIDQRYQQLVDTALALTAPPPQGWPRGKRGRAKKPKARNLAERLDQQRRAILAFVDDFQVPFDNNLVERDIRMVKVQQKISGCFRSWDGARAACSLRSYLSTMRKQGCSAYAALRSIFAGSPLLPSLSP